MVLVTTSSMTGSDRKEGNRPDMLRQIGALLAALVAFVPVGSRAADSALSASANAAFLAQNARQRGVIVRPSGLQYRIVQNGSGKHPQPSDAVDVYYTGKLINGTVFDGTEDGFPHQFVTKNLIRGWTEALEIMREGDHWQLVVPANLAYGSAGSSDGTIPPGQTLVFDLQLLQVLPKSQQQQQQEQAQQQRDQETHPGPGAE
jgi:FKBP-type peptidyl-prolyl cis-trans isomerase